MNPKNDPSDPPEFNSLKKLLAWKRHETPPPGYFDSFSAKVRARIEAEAAAPRQTLWQRWLESLRLNPFAAGAGALAGVAALALVAILTSRPNSPLPTVGSAKVPPVKLTPPAEIAAQSSSTGRQAIASTANHNTPSNTAPPGLFEPVPLLTQGVERATLRPTNP